MNMFFFNRCCLLMLVAALAINGGGQQSFADEVPQKSADESSQNGDSSSPRTLSVAPLDHAQYPDDRPEWLEMAPDLDASLVVWPVKSLLLPSKAEARESLELQIRGAVAAYADHVLGSERADLLNQAETEQMLSEQVLVESLPFTDRYEGTAKLGDETVYEQAVRLRFDEKYRQRLLATWQNRELAERLEAVGVAGGVGLCLLLAGTGITRRIARRNPT